MRETSKTRNHFGEIEHAALTGRVLDIGAGGDLVTPDAIPYDVEQGDANRITGFAPESFDCVYSSHCLEHMNDPRQTILNWWSLVKPGGHLFVIVPDEDLYEQGVWPSRFSKEHLHSFTLGKRRSWSPVSINLYELAASLPGGSIRWLALNDIGYDRSAAFHGPTRGGAVYRWLRKQYQSLRKRRLCDRKPGFERWIASKVGWDQLFDSTLAQLELIVRKNGG